MARILPPGEFIGELERSVDLPGLSVSLRRSTADPVAMRDGDHVHDEAHLMLVLDSGYSSSAHGAPVLSTAALLLYNPPGVAHRDHYEAWGGRFLTVSVGRGRFAEVCEGATLPAEPVAITSQQANAAARRITGAMVAGEARAGLHLEHLCLELLGAASSARAPGGTRAPSWLGRALEFLADGNGGGRVRVGEVARAVGVHPIYLARAFRRHVGCTPGEYARRHRMDRATGLLRAGRLGIAEIAASLGYGDQSHLSNEFRACLGCTPARYAAAFGAPRSAPHRPGVEQP